jgi:formylglycine-generating enzyme required for sulfatase activity
MDSTEENPAHSVYLDAFWIDRTEVTYTQFARFLDHLGGHEGLCSSHDCNEITNGDKNSHMLLQDGSYVVGTGYEDYPMSEVTWYVRKPIATGQASGYPPRQSGRQQHVEPTAEGIRGGTVSQAVPS